MNAVKAGTSPLLARPPLPQRHRAMLRAVDAGRAEVLCGSVPVLLIDGLFCDNVASDDLFRGQLVLPAIGPAGHRAVARVSEAGLSALGRPGSGEQPITGGLDE